MVITYCILHRLCRRFACLRLVCYHRVIMLRGVFVCCVPPVHNLCGVSNLFLRMVVVKINTFTFKKD
jgi:hypothetical protein